MSTRHRRRIRLGRLGRTAALAVAAGALLMAPVASRSMPGHYALPGEQVFPEGVAASAGRLYVSSTSDGTVFAGDIGETELLEPFLAPGADGRTTAVGLELDGPRLWVAGGETGRAWVYDTGDGSFLGSFTSGEGGFINDIAAVGSTAYATDSMRPTLWRLSLDDATPGESAAEPWLDFTGTAFEYLADAFNANGIVASSDGEHLLIVQSATGKLFRVTVDTREVVEVDLGGATLTSGDGMLLDGERTLLVVRNALGEVARVSLGDDWTSGEVVGTISDPSFRFPTTIARSGDSYLVVNSQFDKREGTPELPFTVSVVPAGPPDTSTDAPGSTLLALLLFAAGSVMVLLGALRLSGVRALRSARRLRPSFADRTLGGLRGGGS